MLRQAIPNCKGLAKATTGRVADLVLLNGKIITMDKEKPEAQALAAGDGLIIAIGLNKDIQPLIGPQTRLIDLKGQLAVPGFIEGHGHLLQLGHLKKQLDLSRAKSWEEIVEMVASAAKKIKAGQWILGANWHQDKWNRPPVPNIEGYPTHHSLSRTTPHHPVLLRHACGHAAFANAKAMELAGITRETPESPRGKIVKDAQGNPTGMFLEGSRRLLEEVRKKHQRPRTPAETEAEAIEEIELATQECLSRGITTFQDAGATFEQIDLFKKLAEEGRLRLRLWIMVSEGNARLARRLAQYKLVNRKDKMLTVRAIKSYLDGALGSATAWLLEPYSDMSHYYGLQMTSKRVLSRTAQLAVENGFQLCVHAIGDRANREALNVIEKTFERYPSKKDRRWRIEHAQHLHPADIPRFGNLGVIASMQGIHCPLDAPSIIARLGKKRAEEGAYVFQKLLKTGAIVINGTDAPVEDVDPLGSFYASAIRKLKDGSVFYPDQCMSREEALRSYTLSSAYAGFEEEIKGSITPGKLADITVLSKDIMTVSEDEILEAEVLYTIVGGKVVYEGG